MESKTIDTYFPKEDVDAIESQASDDTNKRMRSIDSTGNSPSPKKVALTDDTLLLPEDAPFWVPTLFKAIDKVNMTVEIMSAKVEAFKVGVENRLNDLRLETDNKVKFIESKVQEKSDEQHKTIVELTESVEYMSSNFENQKRINEDLIVRMEKMEKHHETIKQKCHEYEETFVHQALLIDSLEQYSRRNCLLLHGVPETADEGTDQIFVDTVNSKLDVKLKLKDLDRTHRIGKPKKDKIRPIIAKFARYNKRKTVFQNRKKFKGSSFVITESLTQRRMTQLNAAKERFGKENVWTGDGEILVKQGRNISNVNTL